MLLFLERILRKNTRWDRSAHFQSYPGAKDRGCGLRYTPTSVQ